jgi:type I restriction enzyme S subunit
MSEWIEKELDDVILKRNQGVNTTTEKIKYSEAGIKVIRANNISQGRIDYIDCVYVDSATYKRIKEPCKPKKGDILYTNIGSQFGNAAKVEVDFDFTIAWDFLVYLLNNPENKKYIQSLNSSSTMPFVSGKDIGKTSYKFPVYQTQKLIGEKLKSFDSKIELNRQTNQTLEHMAQAIFKSWFVDFEPTRAKALARAQIAKGIMPSDNVFVDTLNLDEDAQAANAQQPLPKNFTQADADQIVERAAMAAISGKPLSELDKLPAKTLEQLKTTAALFPETLVDSELGEIPEGWQASTLGEHFNVVMGQSPKGDTYNEDGNGMLFFQGRRDFGFRYPTPRVYTTEPKRLAQAGDTLISVRAPVGDRNMADQVCCLGRGVGGIRHKSGARSFTYAFVGHIEKNLSDSGSDGTVFNSINKKELEGVGFIAPSIRLLESFEKVVDSIDERVEINSKENVNLQTLRDSLLPKLLSGELAIEESGSK